MAITAAATGNTRLEILLADSVRSIVYPPGCIGSAALNLFLDGGMPPGGGSFQVPCNRALRSRLGLAQQPPAKRLTANLGEGRVEREA